MCLTKNGVVSIIVVIGSSDPNQSYSQLKSASNNMIDYIESGR